MVEKLITNSPHFGIRHRSKGRLAAQIQVMFFGLIYLDTLAAYNISFIPLPWFSYFISAFLIIFLAANRSLIIAVPSLIYIILYALFALLVIVINTTFAPAFKMPGGASQSYPLFIFTRFFVLIGYIVTAILVYNISFHYGTRFIIKILIITLTIVTVSSLYIYVAQLYGLWEPTRNRAGTGGQDFTTTKLSFSYGFHRALGTFREPSHLAIWVVGIFFFTFSISSGKRSARYLLVTILAIIALVLSGSLLGLIGLAAGGLVMLKTGRFKFSFRSFLSLFTIVASGVAAIHAFGIDFVGTLFPRIEALLLYGPDATNRSYVWEYFLEVQPPFSGFGLGNSNIKFSSYLGNYLISSHLNIFLGSWYSLGFAGVVLISIYLAFPFVSVRTWKMARRDATLAACMASLASWLVFYSGNNEELTLIHAVIMGVFLGRLRELRQTQ